MNDYTGSIEGRTSRIGIVTADFNSLISERLLAGAINNLKKYKVSDDHMTVVHVPGAFEIPRAVKLLAGSGKVDGIITLGAIIRGETAHFDYVCRETSRGIAELALNSQVPVMLGVLMTNSMAQAINRAGGKAGNKGSECASAVLEMIDLQKKLSQAAHI